MIYIKNTTDFEIMEPTVISLGKFDGIHRGHEVLMEKLSEKKENGWKAAIFTFDIPPRKNVEHVETKVLTTNEEKSHLFEVMGIDYLVECPFTKEIMCMEPEDFIRMLVTKLSVKCIVAGKDFHFGHNRRGDYQMLIKYAEIYGYEAVILPKIQEDDRDISSTYVREEILAGNIEKANHLLGYHYFVQGAVKHGNRIGRTIGIPTINLIPSEEKLLPPFGVYVTEVYIEEKKYHGVTNVGCKPTIKGDHPVGVETHLLDFKEDVYDQVVTVEFLKRVRPEKKFGGMEELKEQMVNDIAFARNFFQSEI